jgi:hypothetical protein
MAEQSSPLATTCPVRSLGMRMKELLDWQSVQEPQLLPLQPVHH